MRDLLETTKPMHLTRPIVFHFRNLPDDAFLGGARREPETFLSAP